ncbi:hypothetical protein PISMIDRAFT_25627 [Pisolithus microcarpus 441]|uniref:Arginyl-tRNA synthetase catalytic core domain-containing protein n=1 Tax=Pisolithus microcarpus 441 TaxID=765257 RepID=A0A0C9YY68_9AGAM|nr:hypothetical protein PISMIDRAFT_25627 [Pisolithus microcarpus 441]
MSPHSKSLTPCEPYTGPHSADCAPVSPKDPLMPLDSQDDLLPQDGFGRFIYTQLPSPPPNHPDTGANPRMIAGLKRQREEETDPLPQTPRRFGDGLTNTHRAKSVPLLQPANKRPRLGRALDIEIKSRTEKLEEAIGRLQSEVQDSSNKQTDLLRAILDVLKDGNRRLPGKPDELAAKVVSSFQPDHFDVSVASSARAKWLSWESVDGTVSSTAQPRSASSIDDHNGDSVNVRDGGEDDHSTILLNSQRNLLSRWQPGTLPALAPQQPKTDFHRKAYEGKAQAPREQSGSSTNIFRREVHDAEDAVLKEENDRPKAAIQRQTEETERLRKNFRDECKRLNAEKVASESRFNDLNGYNRPRNKTCEGGVFDAEERVWPNHTSELKGAQSFLTTADVFSGMEDLNTLQRLNSEVLQHMAFIAESMESYMSDRALMKTEKQMAGANRVSGEIGRTIVHFLGTKKHRDAPILIQIAFQAYFAHVLQWITCACPPGKPSYGTNASEAGKKVVIKFSLPNIVKLFHIRHLRSIITVTFPSDCAVCCERRHNK